MNPDFNSDERDYHTKVLHGVLDAVVGAGSSVGEAGGMIDLPVALDALLASIATLAVQSGNYPNPRAMRLFGESCGRGIQNMMRGLAAANAEGRGLDWNMEKFGPTH